MPNLASGFGLQKAFSMIISNGLCDFRQIAILRKGDDNRFGTGHVIFRPRKVGLKPNFGFFIKGVQKTMIKGRNAVIIELGRNGTVNRHFLRIKLKGAAVALDLFTYITKSIFAALFFIFIDGDKIRKEINEFAEACSDLNHGKNMKVIRQRSNKYV